MKNLIIIFFIFINVLNAKDTLVMQQQNVLYVQNLIDIEEKIASNFEKYLLQEFEVPSLDDLKTDDYLGSNFTTTNKFGASTSLEISFTTSPNLKINYATTNENIQLYVLALYKRDLYRDMTTVYRSSDEEDSYVSFELKSKEAENIFEILKAGNSIVSSCSATLTNTYCITNLNTIRWYDSTSNWIEYNNADFEEGNVTLSTLSLLSNSKLDNLNIGANILIRNGDKYLKIMNDIVRID